MISSLASAYGVNDDGQGRVKVQHHILVVKSLRPVSDMMKVDGDGRFNGSLVWVLEVC